MPQTIVDRLHEEFGVLIRLLESATEPSLRVTADDTFRKVLLLSAASHFEQLVVRAILDFASNSPSANRRVTEFLRRKALSRQYHTLFDWERNNANAFFGLFGEDCRAAVSAKVGGDSELGAAISAFMELGRERNRLVHQDFGSFSLEKTADEIFTLYQAASKFVEQLPALLSADAPAAS